MLLDQCPLGIAAASVPDGTDLARDRPQFIAKACCRRCVVVGITVVIRKNFAAALGSIQGGGCLSKRGVAVLFRRCNPLI